MDSFVALLVALQLVPLGASLRADPPSTPTPPALAERLRAAMGKDFPGLAACVVVRGEVAWCDGFGRVDRRETLAVTPDTPFLLASVTKVITGTVLMALCDEGHLSLDGPLPEAFPLRHPRARAPITLRQLLTHTAGVRDSDAVDAFYDWDGDVALSLADAVRGYLLPGGRWYDPRQNFAREPPGQRYDYSNMGIAAAGYLVELVAAGDLRAESQRRIFAPLGMTHSYWRLADVPADVRVATPHRPDEDGDGPPTSLPHYTFADYPDGGLFASARDLARFLATLARGGPPVLAPATLAAMLRPQWDPSEGSAPQSPKPADADDTEQGLVWYRETIGGRSFWVHNGAETGVATQIGLDPASGAAFVVLANGEDDDEEGRLDPVITLVVRHLASLERP